MIATNSTAAEDRLAKSTLLPKSGNATSALHPISPPLLPLRLAVGRLRTAGCPLHPNRYPGKGFHYTRDPSARRLDGGSIVARGVDLTRPGESRSTDQFGVEQYPGAR